MAILRAATLYWAAIFGLGFLLGTVRVLWGAAAIGETAFVLVEVPAMLAASFVAARLLLRRYALDSLRETGLMGGLAFTLLIIAELALAMLVGDLRPYEWFASLWTVPFFYGTLGQIAFGLMPTAICHFLPHRQRSD
ncbi:hypothetical protein [Qipengyuania sp. RANM35]|uniref:hypothetical protein n=1 Tax=Qipengyuania sp. RANM35 TaxID=3068635 RepID=UPI0034DAD4BF